MQSIYAFGTAGGTKAGSHVPFDPMRTHVLPLWAMVGVAFFVMVVSNIVGVCTRAPCSCFRCGKPKKGDMSEGLTEITPFAKSTGGASYGEDTQEHKQQCVVDWKTPVSERTAREAALNETVSAPAHS